MIGMFYFFIPIKMYFITYKEQLMQNEILARYTIIKKRLVWNKMVKEIAKEHSIHRNTVRNLVKRFEEKAPDWSLELLKKSLSLEKINEYFSFLASDSRAPKSNKRSASKEATEFILELFQETNYWYQRMHTHLKRWWLLKKYNLTLWKIKWIYKKHNLKVKSVKTYSWRNRPIYNYDKLLVFECLHIDTKHILDKKALTPKIYDKFNLNPKLPIYQWTIYDAKSRFRFLFYSHKINSTMWINILLFVVMFLRYCGIDYHITIWADWGPEFFSWSTRKKKKRNELLSILDADIYCYESNRDIRKNWIERSHRTDDEEFYSPRWVSINSEKNFMKEAYNRYLYYNFKRPIGWKYMKGRIPFDVLAESKILNLKRLLKFPTLIVDNCLWDLIYHTSTIRLAKELNKNPNLSNKKAQIDFMYKYNFFNNIYAQNVFDY